jgi:hypothetical protein
MHFTRHRIRAAVLYGPLVTTITVVSTTIACSAQVQREPPSIHLPSPAKVPTPSLIPSDSLTENVFHPGTVVYNATLSSITQSLTGDSISQTDTSEVTAVLSAEFVESSTLAGINAIVHIDSTRVTVRPNKTTYLPATRFNYQIHRTADKVLVTRPKQQLCSTQDDNPLTGEEILPPLLSSPSWFDSTSYQLCRGGIALHVRRVVHYNRMPSRSQAGRANYLTYVIRQATVTINGTGIQWGEAVQAFGHGTSVDTTLIGEDDTRVVQVQGQAQLELNFRSNLRNQHFKQLTQLQLTLRK